MLTITVCVGTSCYFQGSEEITKTFERLIEERGLGDQVEIVGAFCMDRCSMGVSVRVGERVYRGVHPAAAEEFFAAEVIPQLECVA